MLDVTQTWNTQSCGSRSERQFKQMTDDMHTKMDDSSRLVTLKNLTDVVNFITAQLEKQTNQEKMEQLLAMNTKGGLCRNLVLARGYIRVQSNLY